MKLKTCPSQKPLGHFNQILYVSFKGQGNENLLTYDAGHISKLAAIHIHGKTLLNYFSLNQWTNFYETWYVASGNQVHHNLFKWLS